MSDMREKRREGGYYNMMCGQNRNHKSFVESLMHFQSVFENIYMLQWTK